MARTNPDLWEKAKSEAKSKMGGKHCTTCREFKPLTDFTANKSQESGYMGYCKACNNERNKRYRKQEATLDRACKRVYSYLHRRVRSKGFDLDFDSKYLEELFNVQEGLCAYTGDILELNAGYRNTLSVDRVDSSKGYIKDNVVLTTWEVNNCKQDLSLEDFRSLCERVLKNVSDK
jgi:hypothetical protein